MMEDRKLRSKNLCLALIACVILAASPYLYAANQDDPAILMEKGIKALAEKNYLLANEYFREAWQLDNKLKKLSEKDRKTLEMLRDESARGASRYKAAERALARGKEYIQAGKLSDAKKMFERVLELKQYIPESWAQEAKVQLRLIEEKEAVSNGKSAEKIAASESKTESKQEPKTETAAQRSEEQHAKEDKGLYLQRVAEEKAAKQAESGAQIDAKASEAQPAAEPKAADKMEKKLKLAQKIAASTITKPATPSLLDQVIAARKIQKEQAIVTYYENRNSLMQYVKAKKFLEARNILRQMREDLLRVKYLFEQEEFEKYLLDIDGLAKFIEAEEQQYQQRLELLQTKEAEKKKEERLLKVQEEKINRIKELFAKALKLRREKRYSEAIRVCEQILKIEPNYERAQWFLEDLKDLALYSGEREIEKTLNEEERFSLRDAEEARIPWTSELQYPKNWEELAKRRDELIRKLGKATLGETAPRATERKLRTGVIKDTSVFRGSLRKAFSIFKEHGINIFVRWNILETEGVLPDDEVRYEAFEGLSDISLKTALKILIKSMGSENVNYAIDTDGIVIVSTSDDLIESSLTPQLGRFETRVYDLSDILPVVLKKSELPEAEGTEGFSGFGTSEEEDVEEEDVEEAIEDLVDLIIRTIRPASWYDNGGEGQVSIWRDRWLIVYQLPEIQEEVKDLLSTIRDVQTVQIAIEARFIEVSSHFLERIGMDFDIFIEAYEDVVGPPLTPGTIPIASSFIDVLTPPTTNLPGNLSQTYSSSPTPPMLTIEGQFLDDIQVQFLIQLTQLDQYSSIVQAPRVVMQNGENVYMWVFDATPYVTDWDVETGEDAVAATPKVSYMTTGVFLPVRATTWDLKYVNMELAPTQRELTGGITIPGPAITAGAGGPIPLPDYIIPGYRERKVKTVVSVPDGGTLLLGGLKQNGQVELEAGPPVISKIPFLNRFFVNNASTKDNIVLLILVKPTILVREELEPGKLQVDELGIGRPVKPELINLQH